MADVPPHLLERSRARRAAMGGGDASEAAAPAAAAAATSAVPAVASATAPAVSAAPASGGGGGGAKGSNAPTPAPTPQPARPAIPMWMAPVLVLLPVWALFYAGTFINTNPVEETPFQLGARLYTANCQSCHGSNGGGSAAGGGVGRPLWKGEVELTFPEAQKQFDYVRIGTAGIGAGKPYGDPDRAGGAHIAQETGAQMPAFAESTLSEEQLRAVVYYERCAFGPAAACEEYDVFWGDEGVDGAGAGDAGGGHSG